jgi:hypothetical protein
LCCDEYHVSKMQKKGQHFCRPFPLNRTELTQAQPP